MKQKVNLLAETISNETKLKEEIENKKKEFDETNAQLFKDYANVREKIIGIKIEISSEAEEEFRKSGLKKLYGGIGIRVMEKLVYEDEKAFDWAKEHSLCLKLDNRSFEKLAKTQDIAFVKKEEKVSVTFPAKIILGEKP